MPRVQARELLDDPKYCGKLGMDEFYDLLVRAGYSADVAQRAAVERGNLRMNVGLTP